MKILAVARTLRQIESEILAALDRGKKALLSAGDEARIIGLQLDEARAKHFKRGEGPKWLAWAHSRFGFEQRQVYRYIEVAERWEEFCQIWQNRALEAPFMALAELKAKNRNLQLSIPPTPIPVGMFATFVADPPWQLDSSEELSAATQYPLMPLEAIKSYWDDNGLNSRAHENCHLYLWAINPMLREAFDVMQTWGFTYKTLLTWCKPRLGTGHYFRGATEHILFGIRGHAPTLAVDIPTWFAAPRTRHSRKPDAFFDLVRRASPGPQLSLFEREAREGFAIVTAS